MSNHTAPATNRPRPSPAIPASPAGTQHPDHCQPTKATPTSQPSRAHSHSFLTPHYSPLSSRYLVVSRFEVRRRSVSNHSSPAPNPSRRPLPVRGDPGRRLRLTVSNHTLQHPTHAGRPFFSDLTALPSPSPSPNRRLRPTRISEVRTTSGPKSARGRKTASGLAVLPSQWCRLRSGDLKGAGQGCHYGERSIPISSQEC